MRIRKTLAKLLLVSVLASVLMAGTPGNAAAIDSGLKLYDSSTVFRHFTFTLNGDNSIKTVDEKKIVETRFSTKVIENQYIKVTLLPDYGGRILSIIYKPTGHELLYQNPIGTPYGISEGNFYYNWLMVYGGIFPTFPEPEHGKTWCLPWKTKIISDTKDKISVEMSFTDNIAPTASTPPSFNKGETDITCISTVTVYNNSSFVDYNIKLVNNRNKRVGYEYWTCTTLAPGSVPGKTATPSNSEIIAPVNQVVLKDDWWSWMSKSEKAIDSNKHIFQYKNLALLSNWSDMGIAYASPSVEKEWWGVINHENEEGILRIANNSQDTPGMKFWTWGDKQGHSTDPNTFGNSSRPYIELWAGNSLEFFKKTSLPAKSEKTWNEYYIPTAGLPRISYANRHAAMDMNYIINSGKKQTEFNLKLFSTHPGESMEVSLNLKGAKSYSLLDQKFAANAKTANLFTVNKPFGSIDDGSYKMVLTLKNTSGEILANTSVPCSISCTKIKK